MAPERVQASFGRVAQDDRAVPVCSGVECAPAGASPRLRCARRVGVGAAFLVAEAVAAGLGAVMLARRKATARQDAAADIPAEAPGWVEKALTACFVSLGDEARAGVRQRLGEALASDEARIRLLGALRDYAKRRWRGRRIVDHARREAQGGESRLCVGSASAGKQHLNLTGRMF